MTKPGQPNSYRPQYIPALQMNSNGVMVNNSAQTQMMVGMQNLIMEQSGGARKALESEHMKRRQAVVDGFIAASGQPDKVRHAKWVYKLPSVASPQPVHTGLLGQKSGAITEARAKQEKAFENSFLQSSMTTTSFVYSEIDEAIRQINERKAELTFTQKKVWSAEKRTAFVFKPLYEAVDFLNEYLEKDDEPLKIKFREVKTAPGQTELNLFFVYPNTKAQYESGFHTWMGSEDVTKP